MVVFENVTKEDAAKLLRKGFTMRTPKTIHEELRMSKNGVSLILYNSGKLLLQGKEDAVEKIAAQIGKQRVGKEVKKEKFRKQRGWMIGSDESLKGDTFGGIVVAAVKADDSIREKLREIGVADSKKLSDKEIITMAVAIRKIASCEVKSLLPDEYNKNEGLTALLNKLHKQTATYLAPGKHIVDKYPGCTVGDIQETKAESKFIEVAAASILAREAALKQLNYLSKEAGFHIPKGSTHVKLALHELQDRKLDPKKFLKMHFRNVSEFFN